MNRLIFPNSAYPLSGDVTSNLGGSTVTVTGLQNVPLASTVLSGGEWIQYNVRRASWVPVKIACIQVDGITVSFDYDIFVNCDKALVSVDGTGIAP